MPDEIPGEWRSASNAGPGNRVELKRIGGAVALRDDTNPDEVLVFPKSAWAQFVAAVKDGQFDVR